MARNYTGTRSPQRGSSSPRRKTSWIIGPDQALIASFTSAGSRLWSLGVQTGLDANTIVRIHGEYTLSLSAVTSIGDHFAAVGLGIGLCTDEAFAAGVASVPGPLTDHDWDGWMWHSLHGMFRGVETTEVQRGPMEAVREKIDSKAMRKFDEGMTVFGAVELGTETGAVTLDFTVRTRMLIKLP